MALHRRAAKRDTTEADIVAFLLKAGWSVTKLSAKDAPDLLIGKHGELNLLIECKTGKRGLKPGQVQWHRDWKGMPPYVLRSVEDAEKLNRAANRIQVKL